MTQLGLNHWLTKPESEDVFWRRYHTHEAMERVEQNADTAWKLFMEQCLLRVARTHQRCTSDDVYDLAETYPHRPTTHEARALGPIVMRASRSGICTPADTAPVPSRRKSLHASPRRVWESLIFEGAA